MTLVFVYGTLKSGLANHHFLKGQQFVGLATTQPGFVLFDLDGYPGMAPEPDGTEGVVGEVWSVDSKCLASLDELEGTSEGLYKREAVPLMTPFAGKKVEAYLYLKETTDRRKVGSSWP